MGPGLWAWSEARIRGHPPERNPLRDRAADHHLGHDHLGHRTQQDPPAEVDVLGPDRVGGSRCARWSWPAAEFPGTGHVHGETAGIGRFRTKSVHARHNGTAPLPVWSGNRERHRLAHTGNRQLNVALHHIAITRAHCHPDARAYLQRRKEVGNSTTEAIRALRRRSDVVHRALLNDAHIGTHQDSLRQAA